MSSVEESRIYQKGFLGSDTGNRNEPPLPPRQTYQTRRPKMIQVGSLVKSKETGKIGIVTGNDCIYDVCYVLMHDTTYTIHKNNLELLETK